MELCTMRNRKRHRRSPHIWYHLLPAVTSVLLIGRIITPTLVSAQCFGGVETYEKTSGTTVVCAENECTSRGLLTQPDTSVTRDCIAICKQSSNCNSFTVDYMNSRCQSYDVDTNTRTGRQKLEKDSIVNYFEKICLRGVRQNQFDQMCNSERGWAFERMIGSSIDGFDHKTIEGIDGRGECGRLCLLENSFDCRSAEYDFEAKTCILSREDRRTQPEAFRTNTPGVDYIENQCAKGLPDCSYTSAKKDVTVVAMDDILFSRTSTDCQRFCDDARAFNCRSYAQKEDRCYLSGDDSMTLPGVPQPVELEAVYKEKICTRSTCDGGLFTFEKTTGHFLRTAQQEPLTLEAASPGITIRCTNLCADEGADCPAFTIDYSGQRCFKLDRNTQGRGDSLAKRDGTSYFEKICLRGDISGCRDKAWSFERVVGMRLQGYDERVIANVPSRRDCEELCLRERGFKCRSASYNTVSLECALSPETRRTKPDAYRTSTNVEYLENQCIKPAELDCPYQRTDNAYPRYLDTIVNNVKNEVACEVTCTFYEQFVCRSFAFYASASQCFLSGDDKASDKEGSLQTRPGTDYFQRNCNPAFTPVDMMDVGSSMTSFVGSGSGSESSVIESSSGGFSRPTSPQERRCTYGKLTYEKTTGYELIRAQPYRLYSLREGGIIGNCGRRCESDTRCMGFNMDYNRNECQGVTKNSKDNLFNLRPSSGVSFFEAICLKGRSCGKSWTFERVVDMELTGFVKETVRGITKTECQDRCLSENSYSCKSASYDHMRQECHLSTEDRFTQSKSFLAKQGTDYLENQCESKQVRCSYTRPTEDQYLIYADKVSNAFSDQTCKQSCSQESEFNCRSYSFLKDNRPGSQCLLSSDTQGIAGRNAFQISNGALYSEKDCSSRSTPRGPSFRPFETRPKGIQNQSLKDDNVVYSVSDIDNFPDYGNSFGNAYANSFDEYDRDDRDDQFSSEESGGSNGNPENCRADGLVMSYEKVVDFSYDDGRKEQVSVNDDIGIVTKCLDVCKNNGKDCLSVTLLNERGGRQRCFEHSGSSGVDNNDLVAATGTTYFEKICIRERSCRKAWSFTRVPRFEFVGDSNEEISDVKSIAECRSLCLAATLFECRSATYDSNSRLCRLTEETKRSAPSEFRPADFGIDYLENECADVPSNCEYLDQPGTYLPFTDTYLPKINDIEECRSQCTIQSRYNCRSFNFNAFRKECFLSSDDSISLPSGLQQDRDFTFSERGGCNSVRVECTPSDMLVHLNLAREFRGRVYATGNPQACFELGAGESEMTLRIPLGTQCGTVQQNRGRYVNHVVIQENPVIMQDSDKTVRVECAFTAEDQTVSFRPTGGGDGRLENGGGISVTVPFQPTGTNIVTNTAPTPGVRMRVIRKNGETATMVGLGEDLQLRIEIDQESAFGLFARKLEARTDNGELMNLVDDSGCPVNELIFPALDLETETRALYADFKAFRFPSTPIVNFIATVQFCQDLCDPMECIGGLQSYGRKRRSLRHKFSKSANSTSVKLEREKKEDAPDSKRYYYENWDPSRKRNATSQRTPKKISRMLRSTDNRPRRGKLLPEHIDLGLRLTVGEDLIQKPFLESKHGDGKFPEMQPHTEAAPNPYYPSLPGSPVEKTDSNYVCSPQMTIVASIIIVAVLIIGLIAGFAIFYRYKKRQWLSGRKGSDYRTPSSFLSTVSGNMAGNRRIHPNPLPSSSNSYPPPLPARPATASGAFGKMGGSTHTLSKVDGSSPTLPGSADSINRTLHSSSYGSNQSQQFTRQRIQGLNVSNTNISREQQ